MSAADQIRLNFLTIVSLLRRGHFGRAAFSLHGLVKGILNFGLWSELGRRHEQGIFSVARDEEAREIAGGRGLTWQEQAVAYLRGFTDGREAGLADVPSRITVL